MIKYHSIRYKNIYSIFRHKKSQKTLIEMFLTNTDNDDNTVKYSLVVFGILS